MADPQVHAATNGSSVARRGLIVVVAAAVVVWVVGERHLVPEVWHQLRTTQPGWLAVMLVATGLALVNLAMFHAAAQRAAGMTTRPLELLRPAIVANGLNMITKSGGLAGLAPITAHGRRTGRPAAGVVAAYLLVAVVGQLTFAVVLLGSIVVIWSTGHLTTGEILASVVFAVLVAVQAVVLVAAVRRSPRLDRLITRPGAWWARRRHRREPDPSERLAELHDSIELLRRRPASCVAVVAHGFAVEACAVLQLTAAIAATGQGVHLVTALLAYSIGLLFAIVGFLPGGIGFVEVSTTAVLVAGGIGFVPAAAAVLLFRVAELWLPVALGGLAALRRRRRSSVTA